jgi:hypothetical protein
MCRPKGRRYVAMGATCNILLRLMLSDDEPQRIPITDVFDLHTLHPRDAEAVVEASLEEANRLGL